jgi:Flp pilus assembly protein TadD
LIDRNRLDEADTWLAELKKAEPQSLLALQLEVRLLDIRKRKPELLALLSARGRESPEEIGEVARLLSRYGFTREAEEAYKVFAARDPKQPERVLPLGVFLVGQDRISEALELFKKAWLTCRPEQVAAAALVLYESKSADEALRRQVADWVSEAVKNRPDELALAARLGVIRVREGKFDEAESIFRRLLTRDSTNVEALNDLAWLLAMRDPSKASEAIALVDRAVAIKGELPYLADTRAMVRIRMGEIDRAVTELVTLRKRLPENPSFALHLAFAYHVKGQIDRARMELQDAEKLGLQSGTLDPLERDLLNRLRKM